MSAILRDDENLPFVYRRPVRRQLRAAACDLGLSHRRSIRHRRRPQGRRSRSWSTGASSFSSCKINERPICLRANPRRAAASIMNRIVASSLRQRFLVVLMTLRAHRRRIALAGSPAGGCLSRSVAADGRDHHPMARARRRGSGAADHGARRTEMNGIPQMTTIRSISLYGLSDVILTFQTGTDNYFARQQVFNRLGDLSLPTGVTPFGVADVRAFRVSSIATCCKAPTARRWNSRPSRTGPSNPQYKSVPGVADDSGFGGGTMQYQVLLDPAKVAAVGLSVHAGGERPDGQQRQCRRRVLFARRPVLLRARHGAPGHVGRHRQRGAGGA